MEYMVFINLMYSLNFKFIFFVGYVWSDVMEVYELFEVIL